MIQIGEKIYIFGAHSRGQNLFAYLAVLFPTVKVESFLYSNNEMNPKEINGIDVININNINVLSDSTEVWVATKSIYFEEIEKEVYKRGNVKIVFVDSQIDNELRNLYVKKMFSERGINIRKVSSHMVANMVTNANKAMPPAIYMAKSIFDKPVKNFPLSKYILPVQAGAALTESRIAELTDDVGLNISHKNKQYCELTVLYWIWKNTVTPWVGLCHYRRQFILSDEDIELLPQTDLDVILPTPSICQPSIGDNYRKRHSCQDWEHLLEIIQGTYPDFYELAIQLWESAYFGNLYFTCNMFIMKREVLNEYCDWLFPILLEMEQFGGQKEDPYQNRYLGFIAERLMSLYFIYYIDKYKIAYADKKFIGRS